VTTVVDGDKLLGIISDGDLRRLLERHSRASRNGTAVFELTAADCMTPSPLTIAPQEFAAAALALMEQRRITSLAVVDEVGALRGLVHLHDLWGTQML